MMEQQQRELLDLTAGTLRERSVPGSRFQVFLNNGVSPKAQAAAALPVRQDCEGDTGRLAAIEEGLRRERQERETLAGEVRELKRQIHDATVQLRQQELRLKMLQQEAGKRFIEGSGGNHTSKQHSLPDQKLPQE